VTFSRWFRLRRSDDPGVFRRPRRSQTAELEAVSGTWAAKIVEEAGLAAPPALRGPEGDAFLEEYFESPLGRDLSEDALRPSRNPLTYERTLNRRMAESILRRFGEWQARSASGYRVLEANAIEGRRKLVSAGLDAHAIRMNRFDNGPNETGKEHDERESGQEEIYAALRGSGILRVDGEEIPLEPGRYVLVEPGSTRQVVAGPNGLSYLVVGARV
jgi:quercetin dioxygenase-like cupin family protein